MDAISATTSKIVSTIVAEFQSGDAENDKYLETQLTSIVKQGVTEFASTFKGASVVQAKPVSAPAPMASLTPVSAPSVTVKKVNGRNLFTSRICASLGKEEVKKRGGMTGKNAEGVSWLSELWNGLSEEERKQYTEEAKALSVGSAPRKANAIGGSTWTNFVKMWSAKCKELKIAYDVSAVKLAYPQFKALSADAQSTFFNTFQISAVPMQA